MIKFVLRAVSTLENTDGEQQHFVNFLLAGISILLKENIVLH